MPKKFIHDYLSRYLRTRAIIDRFEDIELTVIYFDIFYEFFY